MQILNFGSLNIDHVYAVPHIVAPGETIASAGYRVFAGGKGANQTVALARAGAKVAHAGRIGPEGRWLSEKLAGDGVDTRQIMVGQTPTGHALIQVDSQGQNAIVLFAGANKELTKLDIDRTLNAAAKSPTLLLIQNETNHVPHLIKTAHELEMKVCLNPAPFAPEVAGYPLALVDILILNEVEGRGLSGCREPAPILDALTALLPQTQVVLTLGAQGAVYRMGAEQVQVPARPVEVVDTTAAGDTFIGYYLAAWARRLDVRRRLGLATCAAGLCVTRPGAMDSIPRLDEVEAVLAAR
jgi:ribokinase